MIHRANQSLPLTRPNSTNPPALCILAVSSAKSARISLTTKRLAFVGGFVIVRHGFLLSSMTENSSRISRVCLEVSNKPRCRCQVLATYANESSVRGGKCDDCRTSRRILEEVGVYHEPRPNGGHFRTYPLADPHPSS